MIRRTVHALLCLFLVSLMVYLYTCHIRPVNEYSRHSKDAKANVIPAVVVFDSGKSERTTKCSFSPPAAVDPFLKWQRVSNESEWYIYSAYIDKRLGNATVRIISMSRGSGAQSQRLFCRVWYATIKSSLEQVQKHELWIHAWDMAQPGQYYQPFLLSCPTVGDPVSVSVVSEPCEQPRNLINVTSPNIGRSSLKDFVVCLKPLNFQEDISLRLLEWLELQFLLGADKVFVYVYRVHPRTWKVLKYYERAGKVSVQVHRRPRNESTEMGGLWQKRRHEMAVYNDCFYRHIHSHRLVVNLDLDEAIVPVNHSSWKDMLEAAERDNPKLQPSASISAPNVYFFDSLGEVTDSVVPSHMHMLKHVFRSANFTPPGFAQKSFFSTNYTLTVSNHYTLQTLRPQVRIMSSVGVRFAHLHHYRNNCPPSMEEECTSNYLKYRTEDRTLWKFKDRLMKNIRKRLGEIGLDPKG